MTGQPERFDVVVIGAGTGGEHVAKRLCAAGMRVAVVERDLIGGECAYWACIPSKALLHPTRILGEARRVAGVATPALDWPAIAAYRDEAIQHENDDAQVREFAAAGITFLRGKAHIEARERVTVRLRGAEGIRTLAAPRLVLGTGSQPRMPSIAGLAEVAPWTNREATTLRRIPKSLVVLGGSAQAVELSQALRRYGAQVTIVERSDRLLSREDPMIGALLGERLQADGIALRLGREAQRVTREIHAGAPHRVIHLDDGSSVAGEELLVALGREPRIHDLGLDRLGLTLTPKGITVDAQCRAADGVWAVGDVTGVALYTHVAQYQARIASEHILGRTPHADYRAVPRVVFTEPEVAAVGLNAEQARAAGYDTATATLDLAQSVAAPSTWGKDVGGALSVIADRATQTLLGAWAMGPGASEWIHVAALAILARTPITTLRELIFQFPTFSEGYLYAFDALNLD